MRTPPFFFSSCLGDVFDLPCCYGLIVLLWKYMKYAGLRGVQMNEVLSAVNQKGEYGADGKWCTCSLFDRHGGVSIPPYDSLNIGHSVGDSGEAVEANRAAVKERAGVAALVSARQVHGDSIYLHKEEKADRDLEVEGYDALITDRTNVGLMIQHADCQAILLHDFRHHIIAAVHCGWRGSVVNLAAKTVAGMEEFFGAEPSCMKAVISPSLGPCCAEFVNHREELPAEFQRFMVDDNFFDFWKISKWQLEECGVLPENITLPATCTSCSADYFSYRRACREGNGVTGRNCSVIALKKN